MPGFLPRLLFATAAIVIAQLADAGDWVSQSRPFGWLGAVLIALLGGFTLWRAGSVKAWKETADGRAKRIEDLLGERAQMLAELSIPERIEGIVRLMADTAVRQDAAAEKRMEAGLERIQRLFDERLERFEVRADAQHEANLAATSTVVKALERVAERLEEGGR